MMLAMNETVLEAMPAEAPVSTSSVQRPPASAARPSISASVDYLIWTIETAAQEHDVREANSMLADAIDSYAAEVNNRLRASTCRRIEHSWRSGVRLPPFSDV
jgi:hypothetical protein